MQSAANIELESAIISADEQFYEITFSYDKGSALPITEELQSRPNGLKALATVLSKRRDFKTFLVDSRSGAFRGFKNYKET